MFRTHSRLDTLRALMSFVVLEKLYCQVFSRYPQKKTLHTNRLLDISHDVSGPIKKLIQSYRNLYLWITSGILGKIGVSGKLVYAKTNKVPGEAGISSPVMASERGIQQGAIPSHTSLDTSRMQKKLGIAPPDVWETIESVLDL